MEFVSMKRARHEEIKIELFIEEEFPCSCVLLRFGNILGCPSLRRTRSGGTSPTTKPIGTTSVECGFKKTTSF
jgi:hypothetical protein